MEGHLPDKVKEERAGIIKKISAKKMLEFLNNNIGDIREVLVEKRPDKNSGKLKGITDNYINIILENGVDEFNTLQKVKIDRIENGKAFGRIISDS